MGLAVGPRRELWESRSSSAVPGISVDLQLCAMVSRLTSTSVCVATLKPLLALKCFFLWVITAEQTHFVRSDQRRGKTSTVPCLVRAPASDLSLYRSTGFPCLYALDNVAAAAILGMALAKDGHHPVMCTSPTCRVFHFEIFLRS